MLIALQLPGSPSHPQFPGSCTIGFVLDRVRQESPAEMLSRDKQITSDLKLPDG